VQVAVRITPLRLEADGIHRLTINLHPADLGPVQVVAEIRNGEINVQLTGSTDAGTAALRDSLDDLRQQLQDAGFGNTNLDLRQGNPQDQGRQQFAFMDNGNGRNGGGGGTRSGAGDAPAPADEPSVPPRRDSTGSLDIQA
jgi:flagellar hook-length control protein FliK